MSLACCCWGNKSFVLTNWLDLWDALVLVLVRYVIPKNSLGAKYIDSIFDQLIHYTTGLYATGVAPHDWHDQHPNEPYTGTIQCQAYTFPEIEYADFPLVLIDTPGSLPSKQENIRDALRKLSEWLDRLYAKPPPPHNQFGNNSII
jgi:hypothetical protein